MQVALAALVAHIAALVPPDLQRSRSCTDLGQGLLHLLRRLCPSSSGSGPAVLQRLHSRGSERHAYQRGQMFEPSTSDRLAETALVRPYRLLLVCLSVCSAGPAQLQLLHACSSEGATHQQILKPTQIWYQAEEFLVQCCVLLLIAWCPACSTPLFTRLQHTCQQA